MTRFLFFFLLAEICAAFDVIPLTKKDFFTIINPVSVTHEPEEIELNAYGEYFERLIIMKFNQGINLSRQYRNMTNSPVKSKNVNCFDEVNSSSWFENRNGMFQMSLQDIRKGPNTISGPDTKGKWTVMKAKTQGVTPGFLIKDKDNQYFMIKFDPPDYQELASGAEVISTKLFYAAGYHVPENFIVYFYPDSLELGQKVKLTDEKGRKRLMNDHDLSEILKHLPRNDKGKIRALASRFLPGKPIGPFRYHGIREDDPNDWIPHEDRRELRGLRVISSWLNHFDTKDGNSLDVLVHDGEISYVKHYLIDFGATLGSASHGPNQPWRGFIYDVDFMSMIKNFFTLGLFTEPWEKYDTILYSSIGYYSAEFYHPGKYKPQVPNPAFENMTLEDAFWAAKIISSFSDKQIFEAVKEGKYSNQEAEEYLYQQIVKRRDATIHYWFSKVIALDRFQLEKNDNECVLVFEDLLNLFFPDEKRKGNYFYNVIFPGTQDNEPKFLTRKMIPLDAFVEGTNKTENFTINIWNSILKNQIVKIKIQLEQGKFRVLSIERDFHH